MELREFAERILFAATLEDKLAVPRIITDEKPGPAVAPPAVPGRPAQLRFKPAGSGKADFPGLHAVENESERGRLLHFFANHELLAVELMALVLLRFPDAPAAFRRNVLQTLKDEQEHTRWYLDRMKACGVHFGEIPVSGYFWRAVSRMESPLDYVAGLSLTFEQANLDYCRLFAAGFRAAGDDTTAGLLEKIYRDEIAHVATGLKWFRRWKEPKLSDWEAFCRKLKFPLTPQRAKGLGPLNLTGRREAGLDAAFIAELNVYSHSRGRTPNVFVFNPFAEAYLAQGKAFTPTQHQQRLARDLANLPQFLCRQDDIVLIEQRPAVEFLSTIKQAGSPLPEFVELGSLDRPAGRGPDFAVLRDRKLGGLRPWAWGPDSLEMLAPLFDSVTGEGFDAKKRNGEKAMRLYSKSWSASFLRRVLERAHAVEPVPWLCPAQACGVSADTVPGALEAVRDIRSRGHHKVVVKESLGLAGHNAIRLWETELLDSQRRWLERSVSGGRQVVVEPWLEREVDFSIQMEMSASGLRLLGYTGLVNDLKGQYQANWAEANHARQLPSRVTGCFREQSGARGGIQRLLSEMFSVLEDELRAAEFLGPIGIDAFTYRDAAGVCRLKPVVEINPRYTMGRLTVELMKQAAPGSHGLFKLVNRAMAGTEDLVAYARALTEQHPLRLAGAPRPRIVEGVLCLNDPQQARVCLAMFQVGRKLAELMG